VPTYVSIDETVHFWDGWFLLSGLYFQLHRNTDTLLLRVPHCKTEINTLTFLTTGYYVEPEAHPLKPTGLVQLSIYSYIDRKTTLCLFKYNNVIVCIR
jgi:hypothetical protein